MTRTIEYRDALNEAMSEEMRRVERVFLLGEVVGTAGFDPFGSNELRQR